MFYNRCRQEAQKIIVRKLLSVNSRSEIFNPEFGVIIEFFGRCRRKPPGGWLGQCKHTTSATLTAYNFSRSTDIAFSVSDTIRRRIPKSEFSATVKADILTPASPNILATSVKRPFLFSRKIDNCFINIVLNLLEVILTYVYRSRVLPYPYYVRYYAAPRS